MNIDLKEIEKEAIHVFRYTSDPATARGQDITVS